MKQSLTKTFPAYEGAEPYLYFCFSDADARRVRPLLERMYARGTRVWYCVGKQDVSLKNAGLYCQERALPFLFIDGEEGISALSFGFTADGPHLSARVYRRSAALEEALVRCEGFSQELIGEKVVTPPPPILKIAVMLAVVSAAALAVLLLGSRVFGWFAPDIRSYDTVRIEDASLRTAVRQAVGGGPITEDNLREVETLRLKELPENVEELALLEALTRVEIPQELAPEALWLLDEGYTVVLYGGGAK